MASKAAAGLASRGGEWARPNLLALWALWALWALLALLMADETPTGDPDPELNMLIRDYYIVTPTTTPPSRSDSPAMSRGIREEWRRGYAAVIKTGQIT